MKSDPINVMGWSIVADTGTVAHIQCKNICQPQTRALHGKSNTFAVCDKCNEETPEAVSLILTNVCKAVNTQPTKEDNTMNTQKNHEDEIDGTEEETVDQFASEVGFDDPTEDDKDYDGEDEEEETSIVTSGGNLGSISDALHTNTAAPVAAAAPVASDNVNAELIAHLQIQLNELDKKVGGKAKTKADPGSSEVTYEIESSPKAGFCQLRFSSKPDAEIRKHLSENCFRFNRGTSLWYGPMKMLEDEPSYSESIKAYKATL